MVKSWPPGNHPASEKYDMYFLPVVVFFTRAISHAAKMRGRDTALFCPGGARILGFPRDGEGLDGGVLQVLNLSWDLGKLATSF
jgi:hypothetical protein